MENEETWIYFCVSTQGFQRPARQAVGMRAVALKRVLVRGRMGTINLVYHRPLRRVLVKLVLILCMDGQELVSQTTMTARSLII
jgi:hypothetical protein